MTLLHYYYCIITLLLILNKQTERMYCNNVVTYSRRFYTFQFKKVYKLCLIIREIVQLLLCNEASTNVVDHKGAAPLHYAAWRGNVDIVRLLLCHGPSIPNVNHMVIFCNTYWKHRCTQTSFSGYATQNIGPFR